MSSLSKNILNLRVLEKVQEHAQEQACTHTYIHIHKKYVHILDKKIKVIEGEIAIQGGGMKVGEADGRRRLMASGLTFPDIVGRKRHQLHSLRHQCRHCLEKMFPKRTPTPHTLPLTSLKTVQKLSLVKE